MSIVDVGMRQVAAGLAALHDANVVHRDLKPANVLLGANAPHPRVKISDFGISRFRSLDRLVDVEAATAATRKANELTRTGALLGTPLYMAPEAANGKRAVDAAADIFAFGILAYEACTARPPFPMPPSCLRMSGQQLPEPPLAGTGRFGEIIRECLREDPMLRPTAREIHEALQ